MENMIKKHEMSLAGTDVVLDNIGVGKKNAVTLLQLQWRTGDNERAIRKDIQQLREDGHLIINDQDGKGYYIATELEEVARQYKQDRSRFLSIAKRIKAARRILRDAGMLGDEEGTPTGQQMSLFDDPLTTT